MTDAKEPESVRALRRIRELYADVDAWVAWADDGQLLEAYAGELLDHIDTLTRERDEAVDRGLELQTQLMTMLVQRDSARRDVAAMREMLATAFREGWNCGGWKEDRDNVPSREYDWMHSAVKAKADAALTQGDA
jgi:hypothetical protein